MLNPIKIGLLGLGTVGGGVVNVLQRNAREISRRAGRDIQVTHASVRDLNKSRLCNTEDIVLTEQPMSLVNNPEIDVVVELIGGTTRARDLVLKAIANGKHVVTANKALIALHGNEIFDEAQKQGVIVAFEAAVAGGIPIIKTIREGLSGNEIEWLAGIINGTTNFILTEMREKGRAFDDVLIEAQELGYAESDPTFDIEGVDAAHKLTILAAIAFGVPLNFEATYTEGITRIEPIDVEYAEQFGYRIKHLGFARRTAQGVEMRVHPALVPEGRLLANVDGVMNAVLVYGDAVGPTLHYGAGAGSEPTASAVVADLVDVVRSLTVDPENRVPHLAFQPDTITKNQRFLGIEDIQSAYYLRMEADDLPGVLAHVASILSESGISIEAVSQKEPRTGETQVNIVLLTHRVQEKLLNEAIVRIEALPDIRGEIMRIRLESLSQ
ncbi:homoserine dehydrogenase [Candidatus Venteria ishoeyi]|uniref:Homoserine dehydrogenase n=1 Tax=Candidatus Venteria ishoeyi TaxID=1899563 RepID=A0A1H6FH55_9GAMM|nr:homoserine dehydrogenase [Candidatus Venteria ishoeyi]MDM8546875.1 homoserine dehydrogenase [Candidatus Venteria ishoeyi]SEH08689.1 Homoserine dehydrogenase [Candidatus Venteria ishoeyi]